MRTQADVDTYIIGMEQALKTCDAAKRAVIETVDGAQKKTKKRFGLF